MKDTDPEQYAPYNYKNIHCEKRLQSLPHGKYDSVYEKDGTKGNITFCNVDLLNCKKYTQKTLASPSLMNEQSAGQWPSSARRYQ